MSTIGFGGGCRWCTEAVFQPLIGVVDVRQGFIISDAPDDSWSEAVEVDFDPRRVSLHDLICIHLTTHASTSDHKMRGKYRSAIYAIDGPMRNQVEAVTTELNQKAASGFITRALVHCGFRSSDFRFHDYYATDPKRPFCQTYIAPKLARLRARHSALLQPEYHR